MKPPQNTERRPAVTQARLLDAAEQEFAAHGFAGARVQRIVRAAGVNERMLYHYFDSKARLYRAVLRRRLEAIAAHLVARFAAGVPDDPVEVLELAARTYFDAVVEYPAFGRLVLYEALAGWKNMQGIIEPGDHLFEKLLPIVRRGQRSGRLRPLLDPRLAVSVGMLACLLYPATIPRMQRLFRERLQTPQRLTWAREQIVALLIHGWAADTVPVAARPRAR